MKCPNQNDYHITVESESYIIVLLCTYKRNDPNTSWNKDMSIETTCQNCTEHTENYEVCSKKFVQFTFNYETLPMAPVATTTPRAMSCSVTLFSFLDALLVPLHLHPATSGCVKCTPQGDDHTQHHQPVAYDNTCNYNHIH